MPVDLLTGLLTTAVDGTDATRLPRQRDPYQRASDNSGLVATGFLLRIRRPGLRVADRLLSVRPQAFQQAPEERCVPPVVLPGRRQLWP